MPPTAAEDKELSVLQPADAFKGGFASVHIWEWNWKVCVRGC